jgi:hypothetical protein
MPATALALETQTLYAELLEHLIGIHAQRSIGLLNGTFTEKLIKGESYLYWQASQPGGKTKQFYLGRRSPALAQMVQRFPRLKEDMAPDLHRVDRLAAQLRAGGVNLTDGPSARVIRSLGESGLFEAGAVLVGTHAFVALGNVLGVRWASGALRTQDVDLASATDADIDIAVPEVGTDIPSVLESLHMGFLPVPPLDPKVPSTSFKVRGQALRVDLLCPKHRNQDRPVFIPRFKAAAQPLEYLDYLLEGPARAVVIDGGAALVNVPAPARFAFHKLLVATLRPVAFQTKSEKDVAQASEVLDLLVTERPGDLAIAWTALVGRGARWERTARRGLALVAKRLPVVHARVGALLGTTTRARTSKRAR